MKEAEFEKLPHLMDWISLRGGDFIKGGYLSNLTSFMANNSSEVSWQLIIKFKKKQKHLCFGNFVFKPKPYQIKVVKHGLKISQDFIKSDNLSNSTSFMAEIGDEVLRRGWDLTWPQQTDNRQQTDSIWTYRAAERLIMKWWQTNRPTRQFLELQWS